MRLYSCVTTIISVAMLQGCTGFDSATLAVNARGPAIVYPNGVFGRDSTLAAEGYKSSPSRNPNPIGIFVDSYANSVSQPNIAGTTGTASTAAFTMAVAGYDLVDHYCNQFFRAGGENQKWLDLAKDLVAALGTLGTGISALAGGGVTATSSIALGTATAYNGVDIYTRNFLFGADNISSVQGLVANALSSHRKATIGAADAASAVWTFNSAILQIEDHQMLCQTAKIRELVLSAIKGGTVVAYTQSGKLTFPATPVSTTPATTTQPATTPSSSAPVNPDPAAHVEMQAGH